MIPTTPNPAPNPAPHPPRLSGTRARLKRIGGLVTLVRFVRAVATPLGRGKVRARRRGFAMFQPATVTLLDRHPALFDRIAARLGDLATPRLLSFGCSTGEETFTLARYLPQATIDGIDANPACIAKANRAASRLGGQQIRFACADRPDVFAPDLYDAVFCLSVLRHGDLDTYRPERCSMLLPFARFADAVAALDRCVVPGGLLVLWGCNFRFTDTPTFGRYRTIPTLSMKSQPGPFYGPDDRLLADNSYAAFVFVKER